MSDDSDKRPVRQLSVSDSIRRLSAVIPHQPGGKVTRAFAYRKLGNRRPNFEDVQAALVARGLIEVKTEKRPYNPHTEIWVWTGTDDDVLDPPTQMSHGECDHPSTHAARLRCRQRRGA